MQNSDKTAPDAAQTRLQEIAEKTLKRKRPGIVARLMHSTGAGMVNYCTNIVTTLFFLPLYLMHWSVGLYGEWMALYSAVIYLGSLDFGLNTASTNAAAMAYARKDWDEYKSIQGTAWLAAIVMSLIGSLIVIVLVAFLNVQHLLNLKQLSLQQANIIFSCLSITYLLSIPGRQIISVYMAAGDYARAQWITNLSSIFSAICVAVSLVTGSTPVRQAMIACTISVLNIVAAYIYIWIRDPFLIPRVRFANWTKARQMAGPTGQFGIFMMAQSLNLLGPVIVISRLMGGPAVALFTSTRTVANVLRSSLSLLRAPLRPEFSAAAARDDKPALQSLFRVAMSVDSIFAIAISAALWNSGLWVIHTWSHGKLTPDPLLLHLLLVYSIIEGFLFMLSSVGSATNRLRGISWGQLIVAFVGLAGAALLCKSWGLSAIPAAALAASVLIFAPIAFINATKVLQMSRSFLLWRIGLPFFGVLVFSVLLPRWIGVLSHLPQWFEAILLFVLALIPAVLVIGYFSLTRGDRQLLMRKFGISKYLAPRQAEPCS